MPYRRPPILAAMAFIFAIVVAPPSRAATVNVAVGGATLSYSPQVVHIHLGDTVTWTNAGGFHSVVADDGSFGNSLSGSAWTLSHTFSAVGSVGYHCAQHGSPGGGMFGTVVVEDAGGGS